MVNKFLSYSDYFHLPEQACYLNAAYMSPLLSQAETAGIQGLQLKRWPALITRDHFFEDADSIKALFGELIGTAASQIALIPAASYGLATVVQQIQPDGSSHAITLMDEFPSGYYATEKWCRQHQKELKVIKPFRETDKAESWNESLWQAIQPDTAFVLMSTVHWMDGTKFNLEAISQRCIETNTHLILDGTQSIGALPFHLKDIPCSALVCAGYKWLLGPYGTGLMYVHESLQDGTALEESWMNRSNSRDFTNLTQYTSDYHPGAARYSAGEHGHFMLLPMLRHALKQLLEWTPELVQQHTKALQNHFYLQVEKPEPTGLCGHIFGIEIQQGKHLPMLQSKLQEASVSVSVRGSYIRVSPHLYNTPGHLDQLAEILKACKFV